MTTRHLIDPDLLPGLDLFPPFELDGADLQALRLAAAEALPSPATYAQKNVSVETVSIPGPVGAPNMQLILYRPLNAKLPVPVFLSIHGGGYVFGSAAEMGPANVRTAMELGCLVASPEYRLAPETRAPGPAEDCYAALRWLNAHAEALGLDVGRIAVGGMSAGAGLAASLALLVRDRGEMSLCFQRLIYPMLDDRTACSPSQETNAFTGEFVWTRASNRFAWRAYLGQDPGTENISQYAAAARATDLGGLPPTYMTVGMLDLFLEECMAYAQRLMKAGVQTELHVLPGAYHGFELASDAPITRDSEEERRQALARAFDATLHKSETRCSK